MKKTSGFTLVELMMVIAIISIIVGVVIPRFQGMQAEANRAKAKGELKTLQTAVESYYINQSPNAYPEATDSLCATYLDEVSPRIVAAPLYDPFAAEGVEYLYQVSDNGRYYVISSIGQNGNPDISGINDTGFLEGTDTDDIYVTNGVDFADD